MNNEIERYHKIYQWPKRKFQIIEIIYQSGRTAIFRVKLASKEKDSSSTRIIKTLSPQMLAQASAERVEKESRQLKREYEILCLIQDHPNIINGYEYNGDFQVPYLLLEDVKSIDLNNFIQKNAFAKLKPDAIRAILIQMAKAINHLHSVGVVHRDLKPSNFLLSQDLTHITLIDFNLSSIIGDEETQGDLQQNLEGTLNYISPEQTAKTSNPIDKRSDYYSFGATLYHLLSGQLPFEAEDQVQLISHHLATNPVTLTERDATIPKSLSSIVSTLMNKNPDDRYQSGFGLYKDLTNYSQDKDDTPFQTKIFDKVQSFDWDQSLSEREGELKQIAKVWNETCLRKDFRWIVIRGDEGVGKKRIAQEFGKNIGIGKGFFIQTPSKENHSQENHWSSIFNKLANIIVSLDEENYQHLVKKIVTLIDGNRFLVNSFAPEFQNVLGSEIEINQSELQSLRPRLFFSLTVIIKSFTQFISPLSICFPECDFADSFTSQMIKELSKLTSEASSPCLIVFLQTIRRGEVEARDFFSPDHMTPNMRNQKVISINPFTKTQVNLWLSKVMLLEDNKIEKLCAKVYQVTHGNPLFVCRYINYLKNNQVLSFNLDHGHWCYDEEKVKNLETPVDGIAILQQEARQLKKEDFKFLKQMAMIPYEMSALGLSYLLEQDMVRMEKKLEELTHLGFLLRDKIEGEGQNRYRLVHAQLKEYIIDTMTREEINRGRKNLYHKSLIHLSHDIDLIGAFGRELIQLSVPLSEKEREDILEINLKDANDKYKRKEYSQAYSLFSFCFNWKSDLSVLLDHDNIVENTMIYCELLIMNDKLDQFFSFSKQIEKVLFQKMTLQQKAKFSELLSISYSIENKAKECVDYGLKACSFYGCPVGTKITPFYVRYWLMRLKLTLSFHSLEKVRKSSTMTDPDQITIARCISNFSSMAIMSHQWPVAIVYNIYSVLKIFKMGTCSYNIYSLIFASNRIFFLILKDVKTSLALTQITLDLVHLRQNQQAIPVYGMAMTGGNHVLLGTTAFFDEIIPLQKEMGQKWGVIQVDMIVRFTQTALILDRPLNQSENWYREAKGIIRPVINLEKTLAVINPNGIIRDIIDRESLSPGFQVVCYGLETLKQILSEGMLTSKLRALWSNYLASSHSVHTGPSEDIMGFSVCQLIIFQDDYKALVQPKLLKKWLKSHLSILKKLYHCDSMISSSQVLIQTQACLDYLKGDFDKAYQKFYRVSRSWEKKPFFLAHTVVIAYQLSVCADKINNTLIRKQALISTLNGLVKWRAMAVAQQFLVRHHDTLRGDDFLQEGKKILFKVEQELVQSDQGLALQTNSEQFITGGNLTYTRGLNQTSTRHTTHLHTTRFNDNPGNGDWLSIIKMALSFAEIKDKHNLIKLLIQQIFQILAPTKVLILLPNVDHEFGLSVEGFSWPEKNLFQILESADVGKSLGELQWVVSKSIQSREPQIIDDWSLRRKDNSQIRQQVSLPKDWTIPRSVLVAPVISHTGQLTSLIYIDHNQKPNYFHKDKIKVITHILQNASIALENIVLAENMEALVSKQTEKILQMQAELKTKAHASGMSDIISGLIHEFGNSFVKLQILLEKLSQSDWKNITNSLGTLQSKVLDSSNSLDVEQVNSHIKLLKDINNRTQSLLDDQDQKIKEIDYSLYVLNQNLKKKQGLSKATSLLIVVNLMDLIKEVREEILEKSSHFEPVKFMISENLDTVIAIDRYKVKYSLTQILINSFESIIDTENPQENQGIELELMTNDTHVRIICRDYGGGISKEIEQLLFRPGQTTKGKGRGMGLHEASNYMNSCGGGITYQVPGQLQEKAQAQASTTFIIDIKL